MTQHTAIPARAVRADRGVGRLAGVLKAGVAGLVLVGLSVTGGLGGALMPLAYAQGADQARHTLNLRDADITAFIDDVAQVTGFTFVIHPLVKGKVTVISPNPLTQEEVFQVFLSTLRVQGYTAIPAANGTYRIVPDQNAAEDTGIVGFENAQDDQFVTEVIQLEHADAVAVASVVKPLVNGRGQVTANADSNVLVVVDYSGNIGRIREIVREMDQDRSVIATVALQNMPAADMAKIVNDMRRSRDANGEYVAVPVQAGNTLIIRGDAEVVSRIRAVVMRLDEASEPSETLKVHYLRHADASEIVPILEQVARSLGMDADFSIPFHEPTNSLILSADPRRLAQLERVVAELDIRRAQVQVEAIIVEVTDDTARELGLQFILSGDGQDSTLPFAVSNFSRSAPNLLALTGALVTSETSDTSGSVGTLQDLAVNSILGIEGFAFGVGGETNDGGIFGVILNAVDQDGASNILSTPSVVTLDNEPARLSVGQEIPITTGEVLGSANANPFRTIQREEVGVQLEVLPQITEGGTIRMEIRQEVSSVFGPLIGATSELITNKREIQTNVIADDGEVIVLGGLIEETESVSVSKVPIMGDIPVAGRLFRSEGTQRVRTNLMVFIRATIVRDKEGMRAVTQRKYDFMNDQTIANRDGVAALDAFLVEALGADAALGLDTPRP